MEKKRLSFKMGEIIMILRQRKQLSKKDLARFLKVSPATIANYEKDKTKPSYKKILIMKRIFGNEFEKILHIIEDDGRFEGRIIE